MGTELTINLLEDFGAFVDTLRPEQPYNPFRCSNLGSCPKKVGLELSGAAKRAYTPEQLSAKKWMFEIAHMQHAKLADYFAHKGWLVDTEQDITEWLPGAWTGHYDYLLKIGKRYIVADLKTVHPNAMNFADQTPKEHQKLQVGAYHMALVKKGYEPLLACIVKASRGGQTLPQYHWVEPDYDAVKNDMANIEQATMDDPDEFDTRPRTQSIDKEGTVYLEPDWRCKSPYCDFESISCFPNMSKNKVGTIQYIGPNTGEYFFTPRKGYEDYEFKEAK